MAGCRVPVVGRLRKCAGSPATVGGKAEHDVFRLAGFQLRQFIAEPDRAGVGHARGINIKRVYIVQVGACCGSPLAAVLLVSVLWTPAFAEGGGSVDLDDVLQAMESAPAQGAPSQEGGAATQKPPGLAGKMDGLDFSLIPFGGGEPVSLGEFAGKIVVLDFFAHWCEPCRKASPQIEEGIARHYAAQGGNPNGIPVQVLAINADDSAPEATARFVEETGLEWVLNDSGGKVFEQYEGVGLPLLVVVDLASAEPRTVYRSTGFKGVEPMRAAIDAVGGCPLDPADCACVADVRSEKVGHTFSAAGSALVSSDISLFDTLLEYKLQHGGGWFKLNVLGGYTDVEFPGFPAQAVSPLAVEASERRDQRLGLQGTARFNVAEPLALTIGGGGSSGFTDYRALWVDEFYHQLDQSQVEFVDQFLPFTNRTVNYKEPEPWNANVSADLRWEYIPTCAFLTVLANYSASGGIPSYLEGDLLGGLDVEEKVYYTGGAGLSLENILTRRLRSQLDVQVQKTTDREVRTILKGSFNYALLDHLVCRTEFSYAHEDPGFDAWSAGAVLEKDWNDTWFVSVGARYYEDTGEILDTVPESAAPPAVRTYQGAVALRWQGAHNALKVSVGPYYNHYLEPASDPIRFGEFYKDRDWVYGNLSYVLTF